MKSVKGFLTGFAAKVKPVYHQLLPGDVIKDWDQFGIAIEASWYLKSCRYCVWKQNFMSIAYTVSTASLNQIFENFNTLKICYACW